MSPRKLLIAAAGTGGHIVPGLAIAAEMRGRGWDVEWLGTTTGMENQLVPAQQIPLHRVAFAGLRGKGPIAMVTGAFKLAKAWFDSVRLLARLKPDVVVGMGGYVTVPAGWAAALMRTPLVIVNADATLLLSNKTLAPLATRVLFGFDGERGSLGQKAKTTGNPVRAEIANLPAPAIRYADRTGPLRLLVVGGSLGARVLNQTVPATLGAIAADKRPQIVHQVGRGNKESVRAAYQQAGVDPDTVEIIEFIDDIASRYRDADLVLCRAGAITVTELTAAGVPSILVPLTVSTTSHQRDNAKWLAARGGAIHLPQPELQPARLAALLGAQTRADLLQMAQAAQALGKRFSTQRIADEIEQVAQR